MEVMVGGLEVLRSKLWTKLRRSEEGIVRRFDETCIVRRLDSEQVRETANNIQNMFPAAIY